MFVCVWCSVVTVMPRCVHVSYNHTKVHTHRHTHKTMVVDLHNTCMHETAHDAASVVRYGQRDSRRWRARPTGEFARLINTCSSLWYTVWLHTQTEKTRYAQMRRPIAYFCVYVCGCVACPPLEQHHTIVCCRLFGVSTVAAKSINEIYNTHNFHLSINQMASLALVATNTNVYMRHTYVHTIYMYIYT